ncbi:hypothetical protein B9Z19DRAFT_1076640, partial [Tuber borchii]
MTAGLVLIYIYDTVQVDTCNVLFFLPVFFLFFCLLLRLDITHFFCLATLKITFSFYFPCFLAFSLISRSSFPNMFLSLMRVFMFISVFSRNND